MNAVNAVWRVSNVYVRKARNADPMMMSEGDSIYYVWIIYKYTLDMQ
jgi:hypothetical protein